MKPSATTRAPTGRVARRPGRTTLALAAPLALFVLFGMARVTAPVSALGLLFDQPAGFAAVAVLVSLVGGLLLFVRPLELAVARALAGHTRSPSATEVERLGRLLQRVGSHAGIDATRLLVRVQDDPGVNASAGAAHLLFVTTGALRLSDEQLEAVLAHELGHHRGLHPVLAAVVWWLRLPGAALAALYRVLRRAVGALGARLGSLGRLLAIPVLVLVVVWQVAVMWLFYVAELLAMWAARESEYEADSAASSWGYAAPLASVYQGMAAHEVEPAGRLQRLRADHPPLAARIERLERAGGHSGCLSRAASPSGRRTPRR
jgi:Zn-dependent protease with chaperone function